VSAFRGRPTAVAPVDPTPSTDMTEPPSVPLPPIEAIDGAQRLARAREFADRMSKRRSVRDFAARPVPREVIEHCLRAAGSAPSGANQQPWRFVAVSDPATKSRLREAAEAEEREFYARRAPAAWLEALAPLGTDARKPFLEVAPWLIGVFYERHGNAADGGRAKRYYPQESVGIACGLLIAALHGAGLATLTHTPSPMGFLNTLLGRPRREMPFLLLVVGHPAEGCRVPAIERLPLAAIATFIE
jgi:iodotyrosine deiodinase